MAQDGRAETCNWEILLKIHFNNCLIASCVRLYILHFLYIYITIETEGGDVSPENFVLPLQDNDHQEYCTGNSEVSDHVSVKLRIFMFGIPLCHLY